MDFTFLSGESLGEWKPTTSCGGGKDFRTCPCEHSHFDLSSIIGTTDVQIFLYNVCSVHRGMFRTSGGIQNIGGIPCSHQGDILSPLGVS